jgi:hypothetical protein
MRLYLYICCRRAACQTSGMRTRQPNTSNPGRTTAAATQSGTGCQFSGKSHRAPSRRVASSRLTSSTSTCGAGPASAAATGSDRPKAAAPGSAIGPPAGVPPQNSHVAVFSARCGGRVWAGGMSPWQAIVNYLNPRHLNLHLIWEERRQAWLDNAANNMYFWAIFWGALFLILSLLCNGWQYDEINRISWAMAEDLSDALHYAAYCQQQAKNAIGRYNKHVEKCNRVVEARLSGMVTPETAQLNSLKRRLDQLTADNTALQFKKASLSQELQQKTFELSSLGQRVAEAEEKFQKARNASPNAEMVERVNRLEKENQQLKQQKAANGSKPQQKPTPQDNV